MSTQCFAYDPVDGWNPRFLLADVEDRSDCMDVQADVFPLVGDGAGTCHKVYFLMLWLT